MKLASDKLINGYLKAPIKSLFKFQFQLEHGIGLLFLLNLTKVNRVKT